MIKKTVVAIAVSAIACAAWTSSASAAKHKQKMAPPPAKAETIPGVNPMTNAAPTPAVANPQPYTRQPGVNPM